MKICAATVMLMAGALSAYGRLCEHDVEQIRTKLASVTADFGTAMPSYYEMREGWDFLPVRTNANYVAFAEFVSTNWTEVIQALPEISTNKDARLLIVAAGACAGESNYLGRVDVVASQVLSNRVETSEMRFFNERCSVKDHWAASVLIRNYQDATISNLIMKINAAGGFPDGVDKIFNGAAKALYEDASYEGMVGP